MCVGAGDEKQVRLYTKKLIIMAYIPTIALNIVLFLILNPVLGLYGLSDETTRLARILVFIHNGCACFLWPLSFTLPNMLRACNDVRYTMIVSIASMFIFRIGFSYLIGANLGYGAIGVWIAMVSGLALPDYLLRDQISARKMAADGRTADPRYVNATALTVTAASHLYMTPLP